MTIPVIDIEKTSVNLRTLRESHKVKVSELQTLFNMTNPQSIYNWENPDMKNLPRIDNLVILAKYYNVKIDDLIVLKEEQQENLVISENIPAYGVPADVISFIHKNTSDSVRRALSLFYDYSV